jgi:hypothetical protein
MCPNFDFYKYDSNELFCTQISVYASEYLFYLFIFGYVMKNIVGFQKHTFQYAFWQIFPK